MSDQAPPSYSRLQIVLHWTVAALVILQFVLSEGIGDVWDAYEDGIAPDPSALPFAYSHVVFGIAILVLALWRLALRNARGAPPPPASNPDMLKLAATITHYLLYALIVVVPVLGALAWFLGIETAADLHKLAKNLLFLVVVLHVGGALVEHFVLRTNVLRRMLDL